MWGKMPPAVGTVIKRAGLWAPGKSSRRTWRIWDEVEKKGEDLSGEQVCKGCSGSWIVYALGLCG